MSGKAIKLNGLEARKQMLLIESELNRAQLLNEIHELKSTVRQIKSQVQSIGTIATSAAKLATTLLTIRRVFSGNQKESSKQSWMSNLLKGAQLCASLWGSRSR